MKHLRPSSPRRRRGAALVIAMLLTALGAAIAAQMIVPLSGWLDREYRARDTQASYTLADAAASWALTVLAADLRMGPLDHYGELWATPLPATPVEGGSIEGRITDLQARFNLNSLAPRGSKSVGNLVFARNLFARLGIKPELADTLADAIDRDEQTDDGQSERQRYGSNLRNAPLASAADLLTVPGFDEATVRRLLAVAVVLPEGGSINANTADRALIATAYPAASSEALEVALARRALQPFANGADLATALGQPPLDGVFGVSSQYFAIEAIIRFERVSHRVQLQVHRPPGARPVLMSRIINNA
jgi:general secretion pathway protein K